MIQLRLERGARSRPPALQPSAAGVATWRDAGGAVYAYAELRGDARRIDVPGVASYQFTSTSLEVVAWPAAGVRDELLLDHYYRGILPLVLQARGFEASHASAVASHGAVLALAARKESGKSTLAFALARRGYSPWADDALVFDLEPREVECLALPFDLRLRPEAAAMFGAAQRVPVSRRHGTDGEPFDLERARLAAIVVLERLPASAAGAVGTVDRLHGAAALLAVLDHAYCFELADSAALQAVTGRYLSLVARVPVYSLRYRSGLENLPTLVDRLAEILDAHASVPA